MNIYVGNLPYNVSEGDLNSLFAQYGEVTSANVITDRMTGQSKGFGFVEMAQSSQAQDAIAQLNGKEFQGRSLTVNEARPRAEKPSRGGGGGGGRNRW
jgi:RNA recognition motif-containing protein